MVVNVVIYVPNLVHAVCVSNNYVATQDKFDKYWFELSFSSSPTCPLNIRTLQDCTQCMTLLMSEIFTPNPNADVAITRRSLLADVVKDESTCSFSFD